LSVRIRGRDRQEAGFTLVEVMIATALIAIGLSAIAVAQLSALKMASRSKNLSQATYLAEVQLDEFYAMPSSHATFSTAGTFVDPDSPIKLDTTGDDQTTFVRRWIIAPSTPSVGLTTITVEVDWNAPGGTAGPRVETVALQGIKGF